MNKAIIFSAILFLIKFSVFGQIDENGNFLNEKKIVTELNSIFEIHEIPKVDFEFDSVRALTEINVSDTADAYPWISEDGLRIYYTKKDIIVLIEREHIDSTFSNPQKLSINSSSNNNLSPWLTIDELEIYYIITEPINQASTTLYHASRNSIFEEFGIPIRVNLLGNLIGFLSCPSISKDMKQLLIYNDNDGVENILQFEKNDINEYSLIDTLFVPAGYAPAAGKLAHNDLFYYLSLTDENENTAIYAYERESIEDTFDSIYYLNNSQINDSLFGNIQPASSNNGNYFVFTRTHGDFWSGNDIYIASKIQTVSGYNFKHVNNKLKIYPNPAIDYLTIELNNQFKNMECKLSIFSYTGMLIESIITPCVDNKILLSTSKYRSGVYLFKIEDSNSYFNSGKFIVKNY